MTTRNRLMAGLGAGALFLVPLTACSGSSDVSDAVGSAASSAGATASSAVASATETTSAAASGSAGSTGSNVDCSGTHCTVTLGGDGTELNVLGTPVKLGSVQDGQATIGIGDNQISCTQGQTISAGPLSVTCTTVSPDNVVLDASLG